MFGVGLTTPALIPPIATLRTVPTVNRSAVMNGEPKGKAVSVALVANSPTYAGSPIGTATVARATQLVPLVLRENVTLTPRRSIFRYWAYGTMSVPCCWREYEPAAVRLS